jgi:hypothetical protein
MVTKTYPISHLLHLCLVVCSNSTLVVAKNSDLSIAIIVELYFLLNRGVVVPELLQKSRHCERSVISTEDLGTETRHVVCQVLVELSGLQKLV